jgi:hypothetical protein
MGAELSIAVVTGSARGVGLDVRETAEAIRADDRERRPL